MFLFLWDVWFQLLTGKVHLSEWAFWILAGCAGCVWLLWCIVTCFVGGYHLYICLLQGGWDPVDVAYSLTFVFVYDFVGEYVFVFYPDDTSREHVSCFLHRFLVFKHQVESFLHSLSRDWLLFNQIPFCQLCVNWFVGVLNPVEGVDLVEGY